MTSWKKIQKGIPIWIKVIYKTCLQYKHELYWFLPNLQVVESGADECAGVTRACAAGGCVAGACVVSSTGGIVGWSQLAVTSIASRATTLTSSANVFCSIASNNIDTVSGASTIVRFCQPFVLSKKKNTHAIIFSERTLRFFYPYKHFHECIKDQTTKVLWRHRRGRGTPA